MTDIVGRIFALCVAVAAMFIIPNVYFADACDEVVQSYVYNRTVEFSDDVLEQGRITNTMFYSLVSDLDATGNLYDISITVGTTQVVPLFDGNNNVVGTRSSVLYYYMDDVLGGISADGQYELGKGDTFSIKVSSKSLTMAQKLKSVVYSTGGYSRIHAEAGGVVRDENY